jgi:hypothetical protein
MNDKDDSGGIIDERLRQALRGARLSPALPPRFQEDVWRRIERTKAPRSALPGAWLDALLGSLLRPGVLLAGAAVLVVVSGVAGALDGSVAAREAAKAHYIASVAPNTLR